MMRTLLVVDDDPMMGTIVSAASIPLGIMVEAALSVHAGLRILDAVGVALPVAMMVDILMPQEDAFDLLHALAERCCRVPIMLMSGGRLEYMPMARELGRVWGLHIIDVFLKPIDRSQLQGRLSSLDSPTPSAARPRSLVLRVDNDAEFCGVTARRQPFAAFEVLEPADPPEKR
jgi:DNA-binding response OmpR family regulator